MDFVVLSSSSFNLVTPLRNKLLCQLFRMLSSDAASGWAVWALAHPEFGVSVNPIPTRGQIITTALLLAHPDLKT